MSQQPAQFPDWATGGSNIVPAPGGKVTTGWLTAERPPAQWFNYWQNLVGLWTRWLSSETSAIRTELEIIRTNLTALDKLAALNVEPRTAAAGFSDDWAGVAFGLPGNDRRWVIVGELDAIQYSQDEGRTWTNATGTTGAGQFKGVAYGNGVFVAVGASDSSGAATTIIYSSTNGSTWTARTPGGSPPAGHTLLGVTYATDKFIAVGPNGHIQTSPDGVTWTKRTAPIATDAINAVAARANLIVAVGQNAGTAVAIYSTDGITWLRTVLPATVRSLVTVAANDTHFMAGGNLSADTATGVAYSSPDGITWTEETTFHKTRPFGTASMGSVFVFCTDTSQDPSVGGSATLIAGGVSLPWTVAAIRRDPFWAVGSNGNKLIVVGSGGYIAESLIRVGASGGSGGGGIAGEPIQAGAGLTKSGSTIDLVAADASIIVGADSVRIGALQTDDMHGARGGGSQHEIATTTSAGFMAAADKISLDSLSPGQAATVGRLTADTFLEIPTNIAYAATVTLDASAKNDFTIDTLTGPCAINWSNPAAGRQGTVTVRQDATGNRTVTLTAPGGWTLMRDGALTDLNASQPANSITLYTWSFLTIGGTNILLCSKVIAT